MQTTYRIKAHEISMTFLKSLKAMFAGQEVEITIKAINTEQIYFSDNKARLLKMIKDSRKEAPVISSEIDIRTLIDESQRPAK